MTAAVEAVSVNLWTALLVLGILCLLVYLFNHRPR